MSSAIARTLRPHEVRDSTSCRPDSTPHAVRKAATNSHGSVIWLPICKDATPIAPVLNTRSLAVAPTSSRFSIITERPNVTSTVANSPPRSARRSSSTCSPMPTTNAAGRTSGRTYQTGTPSPVESTSAR